MSKSLTYQNDIMARVTKLEDEISAAVREFKEKFMK